MAENGATPMANATNAKPGDQAQAKPNAAPKGNPAFRALGLPNIRLRLPSRNWSIFLTIVGSWTAALVYDRQQKKKVQQKWCKLVEHISKETLPTNTLPRRLTIYLAAPPGDGLRSAREHFVEYVKPVLVAAALDWDVVEGRREGEVRVGIAERIRRLRKQQGEPAETPIESDVVAALENVRGRIGVQEFAGQRGDIVIGRHTWKEYVRGIHEGWLGRLDEPAKPESGIDSISTNSALENMSGKTSEQNNNTAALAVSEASATGDSTSAMPSTKHDTEEKEGSTSAAEDKSSPPAKPAKPEVKPPFIAPELYDSSPLPSRIPLELTPTALIPFPHILGFLNTPIRMYRFLTRRYVADEVGRQTAAAVLLYNREFQHSTNTEDDHSSPLEDTATRASSSSWEQNSSLRWEENDWQKSILKRRSEASEQTWTDPMILDDRIAERMRVYQVDSTNEERAKRIGQGASGIPGRTGEPDEAGPYNQKQQSA